MAMKGPTPTEQQVRSTFTFPGPFRRTFSLALRVPTDTKARISKLAVYFGPDGAFLPPSYGLACNLMVVLSNGSYSGSSLSVHSSAWKIIIILYMEMHTQGSERITVKRHTRVETLTSRVASLPARAPPVSHCLEQLYMSKKRGAYRSERSFVERLRDYTKSHTSP